MNRIYKIVKNNSTGCMTAVSELAKGAKKGKTKLIALALLSAVTLPAMAASDFTVANDITLDNYNSLDTKITINGSGNHTLDLSGLNSIEEGEEVTKHTVDLVAEIQTLYALQNAIKDAEAKTEEANEEYSTAYTAWQSAKDDPDADPSLVAQLEQEKNTAKSNYDNLDTQYQAKKSEGEAAGVGSLVVTGGELLNGDTDNVFKENKELTYQDPVTGKIFHFTVINEFNCDSNDIQLNNDTFKIEFYEKQDNQYNSLKVVEIEGNLSNSATVVDIDQGAEFSAISKNDTQIISVGDNVELNFNDNVSYYTGSGASVSQLYKEPGTQSETIHVSKIEYLGSVMIDGFGEVNVTNEDEFNQFNKDFLAFIKNNEDIRLKYPNEAAMKAYYESQLAKTYNENSVGDIKVEYKPSDKQITDALQKNGEDEAFQNRVTNEDVNDMGLKDVVNNAFVAMAGSGSTITITDGVEIKNYITDADGTKVSSGAVIKGDYANSGSTSNNKVIVNGSIDAAGGKIIDAKNMNVDIGENATLKGNIFIDNNDNRISINNKGIVNGAIVADNGEIINDGTIKSIYSCVGAENTSCTSNLEINNNNTITKDIISNGTDTVIANKTGGSIGGNIIINKDNATVTNDGIIKGKTSITGENSSFTNDGLAGGIIAKDGATVTNKSTMLDKDILANLSGDSKFNNNGDIYVGYTKEGIISVLPMVQKKMMLMFCHTMQLL